MPTLTSRAGAILALACLANFVVVLDFAIVNVALPSIQRDLGMSQEALQWVVTAYGLFVGGFLLLGGRLSDVIGRRPMFLGGLAMFIASSLAAGLANDSTVLIAARAIQGLGAAMLVPAALATLAASFQEGKERNAALGIFGAIGASAASIGVIAGGLLTDGPGWRWIFLLNIPLGLGLMAAGWRFLPADHHRERGRLDLAGAITATGGLLLLVYGLSRGEIDGWTSASTVGWFVGAAALLTAFAAIESRVAVPLLPGHTLRHPVRLASNLAAFLVFGGFSGFVFAGTLLMQYDMGYSPTRTGLAWLATSLTAFLAAAFSGARLVSVLGPRRLITIGTGLIAGAAALLSQTAGGDSFVADLLPAFLLAGFGVGFSAPAIQIGALAGATGRTEGIASGLVETMREIGGAVGVAAVATALASRSVDAQGRVTGDNGVQFLVVMALALAGAAIASLVMPDLPGRAMTLAPASASPVVSAAAGE